MNMASAMV